MTYDVTGQRRAFCYESTPLRVGLRGSSFVLRCVRQVFVVRSLIFCVSMAEEIPENRDGVNDSAKYSAVIYGTYFTDELLPNLDQEARMDSRIVPEWEPEQKHCFLLELNHTYKSIDILHSDKLEGPIHDWNMGFILNRKPDVVILNAGEPELCNMQASLFGIASSINGVARTLVSEEYGVKRVTCIGAIPLMYGIPCSASKFRKRVFGMNQHLIELCQPSINYRFANPFWKEEDEQGNKIKVTPDMYAPKSFTPGPSPSSIWYKKYVRVLRAALVDAEAVLRQASRMSLSK